MVVAGIYGATDMSVDIKNGELIEYEHVRERHAKHILAIIRTAGLPHTRNTDVAGEGILQKEKSLGATTATREKEVVASSGKTIVEVTEIFSRGDIEATLEVIATPEDASRAKAEAEKRIVSSTDTLRKTAGLAESKIATRK